jgi:hypothetical protein
LVKTAPTAVPTVNKIVLAVTLATSSHGLDLISGCSSARLEMLLDPTQARLD